MTEGTGEERRWVITFGIVVMLVTCIPYVWGFLLQGDTWRFTGFVFGVEDGNSYIAKMLSGMAGDWLFRTPYSAYPQRGALAFLPYILLGRLASSPAYHLQLILLFHLFRVLAGLLAILATYDFISLFLDAVRWRRWALAMATLGGGLGWVLLLLRRTTWLGSLPLDFYSPETFGFLSLYGLPHLSLARALLLWGFVWLLTPSGTGERDGDLPSARAAVRQGARIGGLWLLLGLAQPLTVVTAWAVTGAYLMVQAFRVWRGGKGTERGLWRADLFRAAGAVIFSGPIVVYTVIAFGRDPFLQLWTSQNLILSPPPAHYLLAYGLVLPFVVLGMRPLLARSPWVGWLPIAWALAMPLLAYAPFNLQRRLPDGVWVALSVLAIAGLARLRAARRRTVLIQAPLWLCFPSTIILLAGGMLTASSLSRPVYRPLAEVRAFQYLKDRAPKGAVVLASYDTGNALPAWAPVRVLIGHGPESVALEELRPLVAAFYQTQTPGMARQALIERFEIAYIFWGPAERQHGGWDPGLAEGLLPVYDSRGYQIFAVGGAHSAP